MYTRKRVIIDNVSPNTSYGQFVLKSIVFQEIVLEYDLICDGHDSLNTRIVLDGKTHIYGSELDNDRWKASFKTFEKGIKIIEIQAWVDKGLTWLNKSRKLVSARIDLEWVYNEYLIIIKKIKKKYKTHSEYLNAININELSQSIFLDDFYLFIKNHPIWEEKTSLNYKIKLMVEDDSQSFGNWYEFFPRSAGKDLKHGTFKDVESLLPRINELGFNVLYLPPIYTIGKTNRKGKNNTLNALFDDVGSPWAIGQGDNGHININKELGDFDDFIELVKNAKKHNIKIALDIAFQCSPDHIFIKNKPEWFVRNYDGSIQYAENPPKKYQDVHPFDFETQDSISLWNALKDIVEFWINKGITVFRVDNPHTKSFYFWEWLIKEINNKYANITFLAEAFTRPKLMLHLAKIGFNQSYTYFTWRDFKSEIVEYINQLVDIETRYYYKPNFWPNTPDINPYILQKANEATYIQRYVLAATLAPSVGIYGPVFEYMISDAVLGKEEYLNSEKYEVYEWDWNKRNKLTNVISRLNHLRLSSNAFKVVERIRFLETTNEELLSYVKYSDVNEQIICVVSFNLTNRVEGFIKLDVGLLSLFSNGELPVYDILSEETYIWKNEYCYISLDPNKYPAHILKVNINNGINVPNG